VIAAATHEFKLSRSCKEWDGHTDREFLEVILKRAEARGDAVTVAQMRAELEGPEVPVELAYVMRWFWELSRWRGHTGFGPAPISPHDIEAWARLTGIAPTMFELDVLRRLDDAFLTTVVATEPTREPR
jgi:hypothetical protein